MDRHSIIAKVCIPLCGLIISASLCGSKKPNCHSSFLKELTIIPVESQQAFSNILRYLPTKQILLLEAEPLSPHINFSFIYKDESIGFISVNTDETKNVWNIDLIYVHENFRRLGLGGMLIDKISTEASKSLYPPKSISVNLDLKDEVGLSFFKYNQFTVHPFKNLNSMLQLFRPVNYSDRASWSAIDDNMIAEANSITLGIESTTNLDESKDSQATDSNHPDQLEDGRDSRVNSTTRILDPAAEYPDDNFGFVLSARWDYQQSPGFNWTTLDYMEALRGTTLLDNFRIVDNNGDVFGVVFFQLNQEGDLVISKFIFDPEHKVSSSHFLSIIKKIADLHPLAQNVLLQTIRDRKVDISLIEESNGFEHDLSSDQLIRFCDKTATQRTYFLKAF